MVDLYLGFRAEAACEALNTKLMIDFGYTPNIQAEKKTFRIFDVITHPDVAGRPGQINYLALIKTVPAWNGRTEENPKERSLKSSQVADLHDEDFWKAEGFFPKQVRT
ncbi:hypothetical protein LCGC14_1729140 [marine sediment metagenome]|uniref:Uncharacterized protein n=1 Tax=marine sediment metagenome TaxID=412755 RepID=A0A0F9K9U2_9ZZZZ